MVALLLAVAKAGEHYYVLGVNASCITGTARGRFNDTVLRCFRVGSQDTWKCYSEDPRVYVTKWAVEDDHMEYAALELYAPKGAESMVYMPMRVIASILPEVFARPLIGLLGLIAAVSLSYVIEIQ